MTDDTRDGEIVSWRTENKRLWNEIVSIRAERDRLRSALEDERPIQRIKELEAERDRLREALTPFADRVYNDNGDVTFQTSVLDTDDLWRAYSVLKVGKP